MELLVEILFLALLPRMAAGLELRVEPKVVAVVLVAVLEETHPLEQTLV